MAESDSQELFRRLGAIDDRLEKFGGSVESVDKRLYHIEQMLVLQKWEQRIRSLEKWLWAVPLSVIMGIVVLLVERFA